jgi:type II secretory pathway pseudopilin PulG
MVRERMREEASLPSPTTPGRAVGRRPLCVGAPARPFAREAGQTLLIVLTTVMIMVVASTAAAKVWRTVLQREKEEELIFRGQQYAQAIYLYRKARGAMPSELKQLEEKGPKNERFIRQLYKDPITGKDFGLVFMGPNGTPILDQQLEGTTGEGDSSARTGSAFPSMMNNPAASTSLQSDQTGVGARPGSDRFGLGAPVGGGVATTGMAIMGVHSRSDAMALGPAKWRDLKHYNEWLFVMTDLAWGAQPLQGVGQPGGVGGVGGGIGGGRGPGAGTGGKPLDERISQPGGSWGGGAGGTGIGGGSGSGGGTGGGPKR